VSAGVVVSRLAIAPVKGLAVVRVPSVRLTSAGVREDRRFFLLDDDGKVVTIRRHAELAAVVPSWIPGSRRLDLTLPGGEVVGGDAELELGERVESELYGRPRVGREVLGPYSDALSEIAGARIRLAMHDEPGSGWDEAPVSIVSSASLDEVARRGEVDGGVDVRRFRMLVQVDGVEALGEDAWIGSEVELGAARLRIVAALERCTIVTRDPDSGERDWDGLRVLADWRGKDHVCLGVLGEVVSEGEVRVGDELRVAGRAAA
jgi:uncharacterized protein YcbX